MTKTELKKHNEKKIVYKSLELESKLESLLSGDFIRKINKLEIDEQFKKELLFCVAEIKKMCKSQSDVLRLAYLIFFFKNLSEDLKERYTKGLKKALCDVLFEPIENSIECVSMQFVNKDCPKF